LRRFALSLRARFIFFAMVIGIAPVLTAQNAPLVKQRMIEVIQNYVDNRSFMGDVLVAEGDHIVLKAAYGYADLDWSIENTTDAKFRIGSLTKQFTAASILLL
jgi:CubicO group peptidase (beta-lactamase class C family)